MLGNGFLPMFAAGGGGAFVLDGIANVAAAYSLRRLSSAYSGAAVRVRRSSDSAEDDIGFDGSGEFDSAAFSSFVGGGTGFVRTWYDQSGNARNATQTTMTAQPSVSLISGIGGTPGLLFDGINDSISNAFGFSVLQPFFRIYAIRRNSADIGHAVNTFTGNVADYFVNSTQIEMYAGSSGGAPPRASLGVGASAIIGSLYNSAASIIYRNGIAASGQIGNSALNGIWIGSYNVPNQYVYIELGEFIFFSSAISIADHNTIGANMATRYGLTWTTVT